MNQNPEKILLLDSHNGIFIPQMFCENFKNEVKNIKSLREDFSVCSSGPEEEDYWECWENILDKAELKGGYSLFHSFDLYKTISK